MSNRPRSSRIPERRPVTSRQRAVQRREANMQRRVMVVLGGVILLALLLVVVGVVWEQFIQPRQTIKQVNQATLSRADYERFLRETIIQQQLVQGLYFARLLGPGQASGFGGTFDDQVLQANVQLADIGTARGQRDPVNDAIVDQWVDEQLIQQGAREDFDIDLQPGEVDQALVASFGGLLQPAPVDPEAPGQDEAGALAEDATPTTTAEAEGALAQEPTPAATAEPTPTTEPTPAETATPTATPGPAEASQLADQIVDALYEEYQTILRTVPAQAPAAQRTAHMAQEELAQALRDLAREQLLRTRIQEELVEELPAVVEDPEFIRARHILLQVPPPTPSQPLAEPEAEPTPDATEERTPEPTATPEATPTPTPTLSPEELEQMYEERRREAEQIYQQLIENPDSFEQVARERSEDVASAQQGGAVGAFDRQGNVEGQPGQTLVPEFVEAAWALEENEISEPVRTQFGWHIIQRIPEDPEVQLQRLRQEAFEEWLAQQRQEATIIPPPSPTPTVDETIPTPFVTEEPDESPAPEENAVPETESPAPEQTTTPEAEE